MDTHFCPACLSKQFDPYPHPLYRTCRGCGSLYQFTGIEKIHDYYDGSQPNAKGRAGSYRIYLGIMHQYIKIAAYNVIDIGAGDGTFLDIVKPLARGTFGFETSRTARAILKKKGYLASVPLGQLSPKIVTAWQVIEHIQDPRQFINELHIQDTDWFVITSPAPDSPTARRLHPTGHWRSLSPSHHLCLYSLPGLQKLAKDCGFTVLHFEYTWSSCHGALDNARINIMSLIKWPAKKMIGRKVFPPYFYGKNSFIALFQRAP